MAIWSGLFMPCVDWATRSMPEGVRERLTGSGAPATALCADLLRHGGRRGFIRYAEQHGYAGKWIRDESEPAGEGRQLAIELGASLLAMKARQHTIPAEYRPADAWAASLDFEWREPRGAAEAGNWPAFHEFLRNFFRNGGISGLWGLRQMFQTFANASTWEEMQRLAMFLRQLEAWKREVPHAELAELDEPRVGNPWGYDLSGKLIVEPSFEYHSLALRIRDLVAGVHRPRVLEIGGGYGGLARHLLRLIPGLRYVGLDLPENVTLQCWYLSRSLGDRSVHLQGDAPYSVESLSADAVLMPNWALTDLQIDNVDVVVNTHSFSEMNRATLEACFAQILRIAPQWIYHDNLALPRRDGCYGVTSTEFPPLPGYVVVASCESRWPRYRHDSPYPCRENLLRRR